MSGVFDGLRVLDLTEGFAGALSTMILADNGASVVRVVPPPELERDPAAGLAGAKQWHRSKEIRRLDLRDDAARRACAHLLDEADVVVATDGAWVLEHLGEPFEAAVAARDNLIGCFINAFGDHPVLGRAPMHDGLVLAASGRMFDMGRMARRDRPLYVAPPLGSYGAAQSAVQGICCALRDRAKGNGGQLVRASMLRSLTIFDFGGPRQFAGPPRLSDPSLGPTPMLGYTPARTKDGKWLQWANWAPHLLWHMLEVLGLGDWRNDPVFRNLPNVEPRAAHEAWEQVLERTAQRTAAEWMELLTASGVTGGDLFTNTIDGMDHPQARHNGNVISVTDAELGATEQIGPVARFGALPGSIGPNAWARDDATVEPSRNGAAAKRAAGKPLADLILLEAASMIATPVGSCLLSDFGARVIKIEPLEGEPGRTLPFDKTLLGKESICIDIKSPEGLAIVHQLAARADMFLHNYRPGVPEKLGIDYDSLHAHNPDLVYVYAGAYGKDGPYAKMPAYHPIAGAICGNATRQAGAGALVSAPLALDELKQRSLHLSAANEGHPDPVTGALVASVLLIGLLGRERAGVAQEMTTTMLCASAYLMSADWIRYTGRPPIDEVDPQQFGTHALNRLYQTSDGWVFLACPAQHEWERFCATFATDELRDDVRFKTVETRRQHDAELSAEIAARFAALGADQAEANALAAGVGCVRADRNGFGEFQLAEIEAGRLALAREVDDLNGGRRWRPAATVEMRGVDEVGPSCRAGQHTVAILRELGYDDAAIEDLLARRIVAAAGA
jgi:crotonobetainyl-CoA:carnitine CoA-transferase CaiB-like acyl-CoA transferase